MKKMIVVICFVVAMVVTAVVVYNTEKGEQSSEQAMTEKGTLVDVKLIAPTDSNAQILPKVIDLYATWCGPCKMIAPIIEELKVEYAGVVKFEKVDIDENRAIAEQYEVEAIPTLIFMKPDGTYEKKVGFMDREAIKSEIAKMIK